MPVRAWLIGTAVAGLLPPGGLAPTVAAEPVMTPPRITSPKGGYPGCYPVGALDRGEEARVTAEITILADGSVGGFELQPGLPDWIQKAAACMIGRMTFQPGTRDGKPVESRATLPINFSIRNSDGSPGPGLTMPQLRSTAADVEAAYGDCFPPDVADAATVTYAFDIGVDGRARNPRVRSDGADERIEKAGACVIKQLRFRPTLRGGQAVKSTTTWALLVRPPRAVPGP